VQVAGSQTSVLTQVPSSSGSKPVLHWQNVSPLCCLQSPFTQAPRSRHSSLPEIFLRQSPVTSSLMYPELQIQTSSPFNLAHAPLLQILLQGTSIGMQRPLSFPYPSLHWQIFLSPDTMQSPLSQESPSAHCTSAGLTQSPLSLFSKPAWQMHTLCPSIVPHLPFVHLPFVRHC